MKQTLQYKSSQIAYYTYGSGDQMLFCYHGYGLDGSCFEVLETVLGTKYTLFCIDLPFHGGTDWQEGLSFNSHDLIKIMTALNFKSDETFSLLGYSMGGRIVLQVLEDYPKFIKQVALVAPDGLRFNAWQHFATHTKVGKRLFKFTMDYPMWFFGLVKVFYKLHLLTRPMAKFVHYHIDSGIERDILYKRWNVLQAFKPNLKDIKHVIHENKIPVNLLFGEYDRVIKTKQGIIFSADEPLITVSQTKSGHKILKEQFAEDVGGLLDKKR